MNESTNVYEVVVRREDGVWLAVVPELPGVHTFARTLPRLREHLADAIAVWLELERMDAGERDPHVDRGAVKTAFRYELPASARRATETARSRRERAAQADRKAADAILDAVGQLSAMGISQRDAAVLLDLSHQRIGQLSRTLGPTAQIRSLRAGRPASPSSARRRRS
jgi:predicted RNase H-like HicB family nuclease